MKKILITLFSLIAISGFAEDNAVEKAAIAKRLEKVGIVNVAAPSATETPPVAPVVAKPIDVSAGESTYQRYCVICHGAGVAGAPKLGNAADWAPRIKKGKKALLASVVNGLNAMPPKGTCTDCSEAVLSQAIDYMLPKKP